MAAAIDGDSMEMATTSHRHVALVWSEVWTP